MKSLRKIKSPAALATLGGFCVPEPFGACLVLAAAVWWSSASGTAVERLRFAPESAFSSASARRPAACRRNATARSPASACGDGSARSFCRIGRERSGTRQRSGEVSGSIQPSHFPA